MKIISIFIFIIQFSFATNISNIKQQNTEILNSKNIWIKTYQNSKNYNIVINNISKIELKIKDSKSNSHQLEELNKRYNLYKSKLELYDKNNNFDSILRKYKFEIPHITLRDFIFQNSYNTLNKNIQKYVALKNNFFVAKATLQNNYDIAYANNSNKEKLKVLKDDLDYFTEYSENIEKTYQNLLEAKDELNKRYQEYQDEIFLKHIITLSIIVIAYIFYRILSSIVFYLTHNKENHEEQKNYKKLLSLLFGFSIIIFVVSRYIDDLMYIITFLSVVAAALTIAMREVLLNIAGAIYIFFSSMIRVGDRVMVQFETKHTIGDIVDISLVKIRLNEVTDYTNLKEVKTVGRTIYIPNSYIFTKVFYNYSLKKNGIVNDLIEFEFDSSSDFTIVEQVTNDIFTELNICHTMSFNLNNLKTGIIGLISYETNYKEATQNRGEISIKLLEAYNSHKLIKLKSTKVATPKMNDEE